MLAKLLQLAARTLLAAIFVTSGYRMLRDPSRQVGQAQQALPMIPNLELAVRADAALMVGGGVAMAAGIAPRISAAALAVTLIPATYIGHPFWKAEEPQARIQQRTHFLKNLGLLGGLLYIVTDSRDTHNN